MSARKFFLDCNQIYLVDIFESDAQYDILGTAADSAGCAVQLCGDNSHAH